MPVRLSRQAPVVQRRDADRSARDFSPGRV